MQMLAGQLSLAAGPNLFAPSTIQQSEEQYQQLVSDLQCTVHDCEKLTQAAKHQHSVLAVHTCMVDRVVFPKSY